MTATINLSLNIPQDYSVSLLKKQLAEYAMHLVASRKPHEKAQAVPRKVVISDKIRRMSGRYPVPENLDYKELRASEMEATYNVI